MENTRQTRTGAEHTLTSNDIESLVIAELSNVKADIRQEMATLMQSLESEFLCQLMKALVQTSNSIRDASIKQLVSEAVKAKLMD